jgi:hypothetical protein
MSVVFAVVVAVVLSVFGWWTAWAVLWLVPVSFFFQDATFLYTHTEHRWWIYGNAERLTRRQRDQLTFGRVVGESVPATAGRSPLARVLLWAGWWARLVVVHVPYRLFVLVGDTVQHDLHHVRPTCDWANSPRERAGDLEGGSDRYSEVWGSIVDHLYAAGQVRVDDPRRAATTATTPAAAAATTAGLATAPAFTTVGGGDR